MKFRIEPRIPTQADVFRQLGQSVAQDAINAGWLAPRAFKPNGKRSKLYATEDVRKVEDRILAGEYPEKP